MPARGAATKTSARTTSIPEPEGLTLESPLAAKLAWVIGNIDRVPKRGINQFHGYEYVTESDLVDTIRPLLSKVGIVIIPSLASYTYEAGAATTKRGGSLARTYIEMEYTVTDGHDQYRFTIPGEALDDADKGVYKALTGSMKYALMKLCQVSTGDDPERDSKVDGSVTINPSDRRAGKGGHEDVPTMYQLQRISVTMREKHIPRSILVGAISQWLGEFEQQPDYDGEQFQPWVVAQLQRLTNGQAGKLIEYLDALENFAETGSDDAA